jgi:hypothetical protein
MNRVESVFRKGKSGSGSLIRTGSGSDRPGAPAAVLVVDDRDQRLKHATSKVESQAGRYHHPSRAARLGTPVRFRF